MSKSITMKSDYEVTVTRSADVSLSFTFARTNTKKYANAKAKGQHPTTVKIHLTSSSEAALEGLKDKIMDSDKPFVLGENAYTHPAALTSRTASGDFQATVTFRHPVERVARGLVSHGIITSKQKRDIFPR